MSKPTINTVTLQTPIERKGADPITAVAITAAMAETGALRGLKLHDVMTTDVDSLIKLLPRVTAPSLTELELMRMHPKDFTQLVVKVTDFLND